MSAYASAHHAATAAVETAHGIDPVDRPASGQHRSPTSDQDRATATGLSRPSGSLTRPRGRLFDHLKVGNPLHRAVLMAQRHHLRPATAGREG